MRIAAREVVAIAPADADISISLLQCQPARSMAGHARSSVISGIGQGAAARSVQGESFQHESLRQFGTVMGQPRSQLGDGLGTMFGQVVGQLLAL